MPRDPSFEVEITGDVSPGERLLVGIADPGVAGLTAADYLVNNVETNQIGHIATHHLPDLTPFSEGSPRHPLRLYSTESSDVTVLIGEVFLPLAVTDPFAEALTQWTTASRIDEITILYGSPFPHAEEEHVVFHVGTDEYRRRHFPASLDQSSGDDEENVKENVKKKGKRKTEEKEGDDEEAIPPLAGGFFDGVVAELVSRSLDGDLPPTGVLITPTHLPGPDLDAALRLLDGAETVYGIDVDETELQRRSEEVHEYYEELAQRLQTYRNNDTSYTDREYPDDHMYM
jgi:uncharacterized protein